MTVSSRSLGQRRDRNSVSNRAHKVSIYVLLDEFDSTRLALASKPYPHRYLGTAKRIVMVSSYDPLTVRRHVPFACGSLF
jgi:hypothetical protein